MNDAQIKHMVDRFLSWKLPETFRPDNGISFKPTFNDHLPTPTKHNPVGTNLLDAREATEMVKHLIEGLPDESPGDVGAAEREVGRYVYRRIEALMDAKPGTPESTELDYLATIAASVEEYGEEACQGSELASFRQGPASVDVELAREVRRVNEPLPSDHDGERSSLERELLEALKGVVAVADRRTVEFDKARAVIVKAEAVQ